MIKRKLFWGFLIFIGLFSAAFCLKPLFFPQPLVAPDLLSFPIFRPSPQPPQTTLLAVGDIMLGRMVNLKMLQHKDFKYPFLKTAFLTSSADIAFGNLESPLINNCPTSSTGMIFCGQPESIEGLKFAGFDILSITNNHILNHGQEGLSQTTELLDKNGIVPSTNNMIFLRLAMKQRNNVIFGFLSFDLVTYPKAPVIEEVKKNADEVDILVVSLHWGNEYEKEPRDWQKTLGRQIIDSGAKIILGHHPHVTQPTEEYKNGLIFYSLGNFVFDQAWSEETKKGKIAKIIFEGKKIKSFEEIPVYIVDYCQPQLTN